MTFLPKLQKERTGWRDQGISDRHRKWGISLAVDIDFILAEYMYSKPVALMEYKNEHAKIPPLNSPEFQNDSNYQTLINLGNMAGVPVFLIKYADNFTWYKVAGISEYGKALLSKTTLMPEIEFVKFQYQLRGKIAPQQLLDTLSQGIIK